MRQRDKRYCPVISQFEIVKPPVIQIAINYKWLLYSQMRKPLITDDNQDDLQW